VKSPGFPNLLPSHEFRTLEMSLNAIKNNGSSEYLFTKIFFLTSLFNANPRVFFLIEGRVFDTEVARAFLGFFQTVFSDYPNFIKGNRFDLAGFKAAQPPTSASFLQEFEASQMWSCFIVEREAMAAKRILQQQCPLLKVRLLPVVRKVSHICYFYLAFGG